MGYTYAPACADVYTTQKRRVGQHRSALQRTHVERCFAGAVGQLHARLLANLRGPVGGDGAVHGRYIDYSARALLPACRAPACLSANHSSASCSRVAHFCLKSCSRFCRCKCATCSKGRTSAKAGSSWSYGMTPPCSRSAPSHSRRRRCAVQVVSAHTHTRKHIPTQPRASVASSTHVFRADSNVLSPVPVRAVEQVKSGACAHVPRQSARDSVRTRHVYQVVQAVWTFARHLCHSILVTHKV